MPSTATTRNRFEKQNTGENPNTWGQKLNVSGLDLIDASLDGRTAFALSGAKTLTSSNYAADEARTRFLDVTGGTGGTITIPGVEKWYIVRNASAGTVTLTTGGTTTAAVRAGNAAIVVCDGSAVYAVNALDLGASLPRSTGTPVNGTDLTTKAYVDARAMNAALPGQAGQNGKVLKTDGANAVWTAIGNLQYAVAPAGTKVMPDRVASTSVNGFTQNLIYAVPFTKAITASALSVTCAGDNTGFARLGIYDSDGAGGLPGTLIYGSDPIALSATDLTFTLPAPFQITRPVWLVLEQLFDSGSLVAMNSFAAYGVDTLGSVGALPASGFTVPFAYAALASAFPSGARTLIATAPLLRLTAA